MNLPYCPICQNQIPEPFGKFPKSSRCDDCNFVCSFRDASYQIELYRIDIKIGDIKYGFDSYSETYGGYPTTYIMDLNDNDFNIELDFFVPLPNNREEVEKYITRILNLKAFL